MLGEHAVVLGAGMAGLLTAGVLSEYYRTVTVVERDVLPDNPTQRRGVPQGRHLHGLLSRGSQALEDLLPGILDELVSAGAHVLDDGDLSRVDTRVGDIRLNRRDRFADPDALITYQASRPLLDCHLRRRVSALGNVTVRTGYDVETITATADRVTAVEVANRIDGDSTALTADLVVDALGRASRTPTLVHSLGYHRPPEQRSTTRAIYFSQFVTLPAQSIDERYVLINPGRGNPIGGLMAYENDTWVLTIGGNPAAADKPSDLTAMLAHAERVLPVHIMAGLRDAHPLGNVSAFRYPGAVWRRYDQMPRFPQGLLVIGDALCSLNPIHGQGMTLAALQAVALRNHCRGRSLGTPQQFFRAATAQISPVWTMNQSNDRTPSEKSGRQRSASKHLADWIMTKALSAAAHDIVLTERLLRVVNLIDPPARLQDPRLMGRVIVGNLPLRRNHPQP